MLRIIGYLFGLGATAALLVAGSVAWYVSDLLDDLPDFEVLASYEPPVTTRVYASDGGLMSEFARERRLYLPIQAMPDRVKQAFISAEDKNFYDHPGVDVTGIARAVVAYAKNYGTGARAQGASTITQQVAKNFLLTSDRTIDRKVKEAILSFRIESAYSKDRILELYLNEIYLGEGAYGIAGAALTYFDKSVGELELHEAAYLAALPKAPSRYHPYEDTERAIARRNYVIDRMVLNGYATEEAGQAAKDLPLDVRFRARGTRVAEAEYFAEEVRRELISTYGEDALYEGGLSVRTTLDPDIQRLARRALHDGLIKYDRSRGYRGPVATIDVAGDWGLPLAEVDDLSDVPEWRLAVVLGIEGEAVSLGLRPERNVEGKIEEAREFGTLSAENMKWSYRFTRDGERGKASTPGEVLRVGDVVYVERIEGEAFRLQQPPEVQGGLVAMDPHTGRVLAMVGGFSFDESQFNRATQAQRQPGSAFKPFVYAAALDNGYTPASVVNDAAITIRTAGGEIWEPKNYSGGGAGPSTLRNGIEKSRNLMTVRLARDMGMSLVASYAERFGLYDKLLPVLPMSLGSGETTVLKMVSAYSVIANGGKQITPSLIDRIQNRYGQTIFKHGGRACPDCVSTGWREQEEPEIVDTRQRVLDPMTAYQITSMMQGVTTRGTAAFLGKSMNRPVAGKTGTTNDERDAWFVGYTPDLVAGVYIGFDTPRPMGKGQTGGGLAAPIFEQFMNEALADREPNDFQVPEGMTIMAINRSTGMRSSSGAAGSILEAFKPGTGPATTYAVIGMDEQTRRVRTQRARTITNKVTTGVLTGSSGLY